MPGRAIRWIVIALVVAALVVVLWNKGEDLIDGEGVGWGSYLLVITLVFGDAVIPVLPGETTLNAASVLASAGKLDIWIVVLSGAVGGGAGDSTVYWLARRSTGRVRRWLDKASGASAGGKVVDILRRRGPIFLVFGRYIPGVRFALNVALGGVIRMPYKRFVCWSAVSGTLWSAVTCGSAYLISDALAGYPVVSLIITCVASTALVTGGVWIEGWWSKRRAARQPADRASARSPK